MFLRLRRLTSHLLFKGAFIVFLGNGLAGFLNYLYHLAAGRLLAPAQYGLLESFIALSYFLGVLAGPLSFSVIQFTGSLKENLIWPMVSRLERIFIKLGLGLWLGLLALFPVIKAFLHLEKFGSFTIFSAYLVLLLLLVIYQSVLQARLKLIAFSSVGVFVVLAKLIFASLFIFIGWQTIGALGGMLAGAIAAVILGRWLVVKHWQATASSPTNKIDLKSGFWGYSLLSLVTNLALVSIYSTDILMVRHFFSPDLSGIYSAVSVLGKTIFFAAGSILMVAFPLFVKFKANKKKLRQVYFVAFLFVTLVSFLGVVIYQLFPQFIVLLLYGANYQEAGSFLPSFAVFISLFALFNLLIQFLLALKKNLAAWLAGLTALLQIFLIVGRHISLEMVIQNSIISVSLGLLLSLGFVIKIINEEKN